MHVFKPSPNVLCALPLKFQEPHDIKNAFLAEMLNLSTPLIVFAPGGQVISVLSAFGYDCCPVLANPFRDPTLVIITLGDVKNSLLSADSPTPRRLLCPLVWRQLVQSSCNL